VFDYRAYDAVKALLQDKDRRFVVSIAEHISNRSSENVKILDVGAFDCRNTVALKLEMEARGANPLIVAIEPDPTPTSKSTARAHNIAFRKLSFQELLLQPHAVGPKTYDCILMQNLFYHIHSSEWRALLDETRVLMHEESECVVSLVSRDCSLYAYISEFLEKNDLTEKERTFLSHGQYIFFEDLFDGRTDFGLNLSGSLEIASAIRLSDVTSSGFRRLSAAQKNSVKASALTRLSFFGRINPTHLKRLGEEAFASILRAQPPEGFQTIDRIAILVAPASHSKESK